ncbi:uncharacterized protein PITG_08005 [Phytophthora infestans T30-4]|uniref:Uncharacterized protein n=1 Tax=Phytophthora infestans (strain T30-4) TaxID=403677 RepID=D0N991_PHYIT|nr:uncharacterized protein PITG_08005 [Phytophthora infestans T30-4]EEY54379.1 conserved hypothetical protein [Phytophthora infestans T30-4]|eukprot:XP_002904201.1 conserved hypothetical protein [Phytophthora infestans T30-4]
MDAQAGWRRRGSGNAGMRRTEATSAAKCAPNSSRTPSATARVRNTVVGSQRPSNQAAERVVNGRKSASAVSEVAPSRWREMRHSVRAKATLETTEILYGHAKIADLCPEDREKVAKLVNRIVEVGTMHDEAENEFQRQREVLEEEVKELREHVRRDAEEIQELSDEVHSARRKAQLFEERVVVLEESTDAETRARLEAEQTLDLLKLEVDKLRALVKRQQDETQRETKEQQEQFDAELKRVKEELKLAQELLQKERNERLLDKQQALDQRLERSAAAGEEKLERLHSFLLQQQHEWQSKAKEQQEETLNKTRQQQEQFDAEMTQLKQELKAAQELLQQERQRMLEKEDIAVDTTDNLVSVEQGDAHETHPASSPLEQAPVLEPDHQTPSFSTDMQGDLAMFEEVKDLYAEDLFASRRWNATTAQPSRDLYSEAASWRFSSAQASHPPDNSNVSTLELSVQEAIERDMEALLRLDPLQ